MSLMTKINQFSEVVTGANIQRSIFNRDSQHKTTFNAGDLIPIFIDEVVPGDHFSLSTSMVVRESTLIKPVMDTAFCDVFYFFVPNRLIWKHWKEFMGENVQGHWVPQTVYSIPQVNSPDQGWDIGTIADYFGIPNALKNASSINALPFRAYTLIYNEWFRDQNLQDPAMFSLDDTAVTGSNGKNYITDIAKGGYPVKVGKYHDYFTSCLPAPQKGQPVSFDLQGNVPIVTGQDLSIDQLGNVPMRYASLGDTLYDTTLGLKVDSSDTHKATLGRIVNSPSLDLGAKLVPNNLWANLDGVSAITVNELRFAFQLQRMLERDSRGGTRYVELIRSHFGVISPDATQQRPEYLGGSHTAINVNQVLQTSASDATTPQANTSAYSLTGDSRFSFNKGFTEHGYVVGLACVRTQHTYQQGIERSWFRKDRIDFYDPVFANIGEQPVYNREIFVGVPDTDEQVFGYQEAWADYRFKPSRVSGKFRSGTDSLDVWHYADNYQTLPTLSAGWIVEPVENVDRTLAVQSATEPQFIADFLFSNKCSRPMPMYSVPGSIDRN